jgi:hypothetical protein
MTKKKIWVIAAVLLAMTAGTVFALSNKDAFIQGYNSGYSRYVQSNDWSNNAMNEQQRQALQFSGIRNDPELTYFVYGFGIGWVARANGEMPNPWAAWENEGL